ncbi:phosphoadenylyl-sulfate reductase [Bosea sp. PAMC 26642]|uniref:phosphoadenylyl-sulfate reductase n=1 Tax=Bosea sp. (strain PAMC 26642) TaxID=1792307 RepID=UPI00076FE07E|nr:phosphoadenylyl-sulfate reductase [Bosea sp. PAMC 26642]AMJ59772.1 phosphoadenosine phosphosulfate reductase [Bosea sp. PAMC 26642]
MAKVAATDETAQTASDPSAPNRVIGRLRRARADVPGRLIFTTSFGLEDQVLTHLIAEAGLAREVSFATLDTGRLFPEVYDLWSETERRYGLSVSAFLPDASSVERMVREQGINGFKASQEARKRCCFLRKLAPLDRALAGAAGWITGLRAGQSEARAATGFIEHDLQRGLTKINPLHDWSREQARLVAQDLGVPVNPLHARGFVSIGCAPCTRAIVPGESERAGRWWWEQDAAKECGLHVGDDGRLVRTRTAEVAL